MKIHFDIIPKSSFANVAIIHCGRGWSDREFRSVVLQMTPDQMARGQGRHKGQFARQNGRAHHAGQIGGVVLVRASQA